MDVRGYITSELLYRSWQQTNALDIYDKASRKFNKGWVENVFKVKFYGFSYGLASASAGRAKIENKVDNVTKTATSFNKLNPTYFLFHSSNPGSASP